MPKIVEFTYGKLIRTVNKNTGLLYSDWRSVFVNRPGLIVIFESEQKVPGRHFIYFYPHDTNSFFTDPEVIAFGPAYFHTSIGKVSKGQNRIFIDTKNSKYTFVTGEFGLNDLDKRILLYYAGIGPMPPFPRK